MADITERLRLGMEQGTVDQTLLVDALAEIGALRKHRDKLEILLIMLVRTGWPWQDDGTPNEILRNAKDGYAEAMHEARELLGLELRSTITRTEPRT